VSFQGYPVKTSRSLIVTLALGGLTLLVAGCAMDPARREAIGRAMQQVGQQLMQQAGQQLMQQSSQSSTGPTYKHCTTRRVGTEQHTDCTYH